MSNQLNDQAPIPLRDPLPLPLPAVPARVLRLAPLSGDAMPGAREAR
jgi:hypothetical protein